MDLTFFIVFIILIYLIYYLINCIQSLNNELKEVKNKCIKISNDSKLNVNTPDLKEKLKENTVNTLDFLKKIFSK
tara:strand:+ start:973 stop:1197 length:225 start_codon:yes stop_codon:yes gene_type:complete